MKRTASVLLLILVLAAGVIWLSKRGANESAATTHRFFYYPKLNVYFDPAQKEYIYPVEDGTKRTWTRIKGPSEQPSSALGGNVEVAAPGPDVWQHNEAHRQQFSSVVHAAAPEPVYGPEGSLASREKVVPVRAEAAGNSRKTAKKGNEGKDEKTGDKKGADKDDSKVKGWIKKGFKKIFKKEA